MISCSYYIPTTLKTATITGGNMLYGAFYNCDTLTNIVIGDDVKSICKGAFYYCDNLTTVTIGSSITSIGDAAFLGCSSLTTVTIPNSVTSIGNSAFYKCTSLTTINYRGTMAEWNKISKGSNWNYSTGKYTVVYNYTSK